VNKQGFVLLSSIWHEGASAFPETLPGGVSVIDGVRVEGSRSLGLVGGQARGLERLGFQPSSFEPGESSSPLE
jgi:hypothetical protein